MKAPKTEGRFAERVVSGRDDAGQDERVVVWIERRPGAVWAVGRAVNPQHRDTSEPREEDYLWQGFELDDCLEMANATLEDDVIVSDGDGSEDTVQPFLREELLGPLEAYFFGRR
ncbi:MAG TPA: hypothetical protein VGL84_03645 [Gaiellaceae bacterium]